MDIKRIQDDLKEVGYAVIEPLLTIEELEFLQNVSDHIFDIFRISWQSSADLVMVLLKSNIYHISMQECETLRELAIENNNSPWGSDAQHSCIFETVPGSLCESNPELRSSYDIYKYIRSKWPLQSAIWNLLFTSRLTNLVTALLGPAAVLFNDQYIVKPSLGGDAASFAWHRDSDWCREGCVPQPYISIWVALDDMTAENGCFIVKPKSHATSTNFVHLPGLEPNELVEHPDEPFPLYMKAGSAVLTADCVEHGSGSNTSKFSRRAWMPQFSCQPIVWKESGIPVSLAIPLQNTAQ